MEDVQGSQGSGEDDIDENFEACLMEVEKLANSNLQNITFLKGTVQRQHKQISVNHHKVVDLTARSMDHNFTITSLKESRNEDCKQIAFDFFLNQMELQIEKKEILMAHRLGVFNPNNRNQGSWSLRSQPI